MAHFSPVERLTLPRNIRRFFVKSGFVIRRRTRASRRSSRRFSARRRFEAPADAAYGQLRARLERAGQPIGGYDLLTAAHAHALALGHALLTANKLEFAWIKDLPCENWLRWA